jgi:4-diphosphocytidyl-2-C-methyl-D-erythritol kinase
LTKLLLRAFAKVNYALEVRGVREDGYHEISTVMQSISLADEVEITRVDSGFELVIEPEGAKVGPLKQNTVYKAWAQIQELIGERLPVRIQLRKEIPAGAGLGGGSADAAAVLVGLNELFGLGLNYAELREVGLRVGADVPFCIAGGTALGEGIGEVLSPLPAPPPHHLVVAKPAAGADTGCIYRAYDERAEVEGSFVAPVVKALQVSDLGVLVRVVGNDLTAVTGDLVPGVGALERQLLRAEALGVAMSGTGTAVYGIFASEESARVAEGAVRSPFVAVCRPVPHGTIML